MGSPFTYSTLAVALSATLSVTHAWTPGTGSESATSGFTVDTQSRNDVISFWHCVYQQSEGYESRIGWTGSISSGNPGTTSANFQNDVLRRINYFRAMAGMNANIALGNSTPTASGSGGPDAPSGTTKHQASQAAALMLSRNTAQFLAGGGVATGAHDPHDPPTSWYLDSSTARNGAYFSNLAIGKFGPDAIDAYMLEDDLAAAGAENNGVGHRRHLLSSQLQEIATGDVTATGSNYFAANTLYVSGNLLPPTNSPQFTPWPNAGFTPEPIVPTRWSLSYPKADFSQATVAMTDINSSPVAVTIVSRTANYADNTIVWKPSTLPSAEFDDQPYKVTVSNILINGVPETHVYTTTVINPNRLLDNPILAGSTSPPDTSARYFFDPIPHAEEYEFDVSRQSPATWTEGAEDTTAAYITDNTANNYTLRDSHKWSSYGGDYFVAGKSFRLAFPRNEANAFQSFLINRTLIPQAGANITFQLRKGYMASNTQLAVQSSTNGGASWTTLQFYSGTNNYDPSFSTKTLSLSSTGQNTLVRFILHQPANTGVFNIEGYSIYPVGAFIDNVTVSSCDWLESLTPVSIGKTENYATLDSTSAGGSLVAGNTYTLRMRSRVGCHWFPYGPNLNVVPVNASSLSTYEIWKRSLYPIIGNFDADIDGDGVPNGVEHVFGLNPLDNSDATEAITPQLVNGNMELSHTIIPGGNVEAEHSFTLQPGSWQPLTVNIANGIATTSIPLQTPTCYLRWKIVQP